VKKETNKPHKKIQHLTEDSWFFFLVYLWYKIKAHDYNC